MSSLKQFYQLLLHSEKKKNSSNPWALQKDPPLINMIRKHEK